MDVLPAYLYTRVPDTQGRQKRVLDPLKLDLQAVVSCNVGTGSSKRTASALTHEAISLALNC